MTEPCQKNSILNSPRQLAIRIMKIVPWRADDVRARRLAPKQDQPQHGIKSLFRQFALQRPFSTLTCAVLAQTGWRAANSAGSAMNGWGG
jgi:hypothetical protein